MQIEYYHFFQMYYITQNKLIYLSHKYQDFFAIRKY